jgi:hypothetical protein
MLKDLASAWQRRPASVRQDLAAFDCPRFLGPLFEKT